MNELLTQQEADQLVGKSWPEILAAKAKLTKLDERQAELACLEERYQAGRRVNILLTDEQGLIGFTHRADGLCPLIDQVLTLCTMQLMHERSKLFKTHTLPKAP